MKELDETDPRGGGIGEGAIATENNPGYLILQRTAGSRPSGDEGSEGGGGRHNEGHDNFWECCNRHFVLTHRKISACSLCCP